MFIKASTAAFDTSFSDQKDFQACLPLMSATAKEWLSTQLRLFFPEGHNWLGSLK
jgi:hypothetical protein